MGYWLARAGRSLPSGLTTSAGNMKLLGPGLPRVHLNL